MEYFPIVNEEGEVTGRASRKECHSGTFWLHPVVHLHVLNSQGELYLQKRSMNKDIQPGKWDTAVGGHVDYGESIEEALRREAHEELSIKVFTPMLMLKYKYTSELESELVHSFYTVFDGEPVPDGKEISEGRFWAIPEIFYNLGKGIFTPNFEMEFQRIINEKLLPV
ncbi:NUDIX domain-containing protein [Paludibacter sp. 221]|uniref:NUDIX hydrolase n=1 Tax=Paludibacter sp. 221 TaxID=2302939 RepID=UPI0013D4DB08|nr:MunI family type II restriction endonuclease [Paludibacter sp. 221]NDV47366.1 NUDIX domain-containing protein [Paludibacter sp. 221]